MQIVILTWVINLEMKTKTMAQIVITTAYSFTNQLKITII